MTEKHHFLIDGSRSVCMCGLPRSDSIHDMPHDYSNYNAPFCHHPEKCGPVGRCLREIACND